MLLQNPKGYNKLVTYEISFWFNLMFICFRYCIFQKVYTFLVENTFSTKGFALVGNNQGWRQRDERRDEAHLNSVT